MESPEAPVEVYLDDALIWEFEQLFVSGELAADYYEFPIPPGDHELEVRHILYETQNVSSEDEDFFANIYFMELRRIPKFKQVTGPVYGIEGETFPLEIRVQTWDSENLNIELQKQNPSGAWATTPLTMTETGSVPLGSSGRMVTYSHDWSSSIPADSGIYRWRAMDGIGSVESEPFRIRILDPINDEIEQIFKTYSIHWGQNLPGYPWQIAPTADDPKLYTPNDLPAGLGTSLFATLEGPGEVSFEWSAQDGSFAFYIDENFQAACESMTDVLESFSLGDGTHLLRWTFTKEGFNGQARLSQIDWVEPPMLTDFPLDTVLGNSQIGNPYSLSVKVWPPDFEVDRLQWFKDGEAIPGATGLTLEFSALEPEDAGTYHVGVDSGDMASPSATILIRPDLESDPVNGFLLSNGVGPFEEESNSFGFSETRWSGLRSRLGVRQLAQATIEVGETFEHKGLRVTVDSFDDSTGVYHLDVESDPPPHLISDLTVPSVWLDSPLNGFENFMFGTAGPLNDPVLTGDRIQQRIRPVFRWDGLFPELVFLTSYPEHRLSFRVNNVGPATAENVQGTVYILPPTELFIGLDPFNRLQMKEKALAIYEVEPGSLGHEQTRIVTVNHKPDGPFQAMLVLDKAENEPAFLNNFHHATFFVVLPHFGSPYEPIEQTLTFTNPSQHRHAVYARVAGLPENWELEITDPDTGAILNQTLLDSGESGDFHVTIQPPDPLDAKPGEHVQPRLQMWTDLGDTFVLAGEIQMDVILSHPTLAELQVKENSDSTTIIGELQYYELDENGDKGDPLALVDHWVRLEITSTEGELWTEVLKTDENGVVSFDMQTRAGILYAAQLFFDGGFQYAATASDSVQFGEEPNNRIHDITLTRNSIIENANSGRVVGPLSASGPVSDDVTFSLVPDADGYDNRNFEIIGSMLQVRFGMDHETTPVAQILVQAHQGSEVLLKALNIEILDDNFEDTDGDGFTEEKEELAGTSDLRADTDLDGFDDLTEINLGLNPLDPSEFPVTTWKLKSKHDFTQPVSARWSENERCFYVGRRNVDGEEGIYRISEDGTTTLLVEGERIAGLVLHPEEPVLFFAEDVSGEVHRVTYDPSREPVVAVEDQIWASEFHEGDDDPVGMKWVYEGSAPGFLKPDWVVIADHGNGNPSEVWQFNTDIADRERPIHSDDGSLQRPVDVALSRDSLYVLDEQPDVPHERLYRVSSDGSLDWVPNYQLSGFGKGIVVDPITGDLLIAMDEGEKSKIYRLNPWTGDHKLELQTFSENTARACLDISQDGQTLAVNDYAGNAVYLYERQLSRGLQLNAVEPVIAQVGKTVFLEGWGFETLESLKIGEVEAPDFEVQSSSSVSFVIAEKWRSGKITLKNSVNELNSNKRLFIAEPPTAVTLTANQVFLPSNSGTVVGSFEVEDGDQPVDSFDFKLLPVDDYPENSLFRIFNHHLILDQFTDQHAEGLSMVGVKVLDGFGFELEAELEIEWRYKPFIIAEPESVEAEPGSNIALNVDAGGTGPLFYQWYFNEIFIPGAIESTYQINNLQANDAGSYYVKALDNDWQTRSKDVFVTIKETVPKIPDQIRIHSVAFNQIGMLSLDFELLGEGEFELELQVSPDLESWQTRDSQTFAPGVHSWPTPLLRGPAGSQRYLRIRYQQDAN